MKLIMSPDLQDSKKAIILQENSSFSTKAVEKQQLILQAGGSQQLFFNQRNQNQRKLYKPKNVNLKHMAAVRGSQTELQEESKASLNSQGINVANSKIVSPNKLIQQS